MAGIAGRFRYSATVSAKDSTGQYLSLSNTGPILVHSSVSIEGTTNISGNYVQVKSLKPTVSGTTYDVELSHAISISVGDTLYFDYDTFGLRLAKKNADASTASMKDTLFDSRIRRRGVIYSQGRESSLSSTQNFKGSRDTLGYVPLVVFSETKSGLGITSSGAGTGFFVTSEQGFGQQFRFKETELTPMKGSFTFGVGPQSTSPNRESNNTCTNLRYKVLRIPCAYGYMTSANFDNVTTTATDRGNLASGFPRHEKDKTRVYQGDFTNSTAGYSSAGGMFVSRTGKDVLTCGIDDIIMGTDNGVADTALRGEEQKLAVNYDSVITSTTTTPTVEVSGSASANATVNLSIFNPYTVDASPVIRITSGLGSYTVTKDNLYNNYAITMGTSAASFNLAYEKEIIGLAGVF